MGRFAQWQQSANDNARIACGEARMHVYTRTELATRPHWHPCNTRSPKHHGKPRIARVSPHLGDNSTRELRARLLTYHMSMSMCVIITIVVVVEAYADADTEGTGDSRQRSTTRRRACSDYEHAIYTISVPTTPDTFACQWYDSKYDDAVVSAELTAPDLSLCTLLLYCSGCGRHRCCSVLRFAVFASCDLITVVMSCLRDASHAPSCESVGV